MGQTARDNRQMTGNNRQTVEKVTRRSCKKPPENSIRSNKKAGHPGKGNVRAAGNSGKIIAYTDQTIGNSERRVQYRDVELWDLDEREPVRYGDRRTRQNTVSARRRKGNPRPVQSLKRRRAKRRKVYLYRAAALSFIVICLILIYFLTGAIYRLVRRDTGRGVVQILSDKETDNKIVPPDIIEDYLEINDYSRPGTKLEKINSIFVHYTANPGTTAEQNRSYFANLAETHERSASAHFIIGYDGELLQCIPLDEEAYAVKTRNGDSISIECCYLAEDGAFTQETYDTLVHTLAWLIDEYDLSVDDILRHYDCGGKLCPLYYAEHEEAWEQLRNDVADYENPEKVTE